MEVRGAQRNSKGRPVSRALLWVLPFWGHVGDCTPECHRFLQREPTTPVGMGRAVVRDMRH